MKIDFSQTEIKKEEMYPAVSNAGKQRHLSASEVYAGGVFTEIGSNAMDNLHAYSKKTRTAADELANIENFDEKLNRNYMAVMSNTMSGKDFKELVENGYAPGQMQPEDAVNSLDRMKVKLAQAGMDVAGYTDTVSSEEVAEVTGSVAEAGRITSGSGQIRTEAGQIAADDHVAEIPSDTQIAEELKASDLPATEENIKDIKKAFDIASQLKPLSDASVKYMVENEMEPTISNVYEAQFSTGSAGSSRKAGYFYDGNSGYLAAAGNESGMENNAAMDHQIEELISKAGFEPVREIKDDAKDLIESGIPLTKETLRLFEDIKGIDLKADIGEMKDAIAQGKRPADAYLYRNYRSVKADRQLKETELAMTSEANRKLLKSDYSIDTSKLENEVEGLKDSEKKLWDLLDETITAAKDIGSSPAELISEVAFFEMAGTKFFDGLKDADSLTLTGLQKEGAILKQRYDNMQETYEAVGTQVRHDLGDSIKKAFANVDELIDETGLEVNDENRRAVRILGYSSMDINTENIEKVKEADGKVNDMIKMLTPKNVLSLIRENVNPLNMSIEELSEKLASYEYDAQTEVEKFANYLVKMRNAGEISGDESASYIGIYRLVDKIVKSDGAAVGALINQDADLSMKNLLSALRTSRRGHMDYVIDNEFGGTSGVDDATILKIDTEISTAFTEEYYEEEARKFVDAAKAEERIYRLFERNDIEPSADNINAAARLLGSKGNFLKKVFDGEKDKKDSRLKESRDRIVEKMDDPEEFAEAYDEMINEEVIAAFEGERLDIRILQSSQRVTSIQRTLAQTENYQVPVEIKGELTSINLQIKHGEKRGNVDILFESETLGRVSASFSLSETTTEGIVSCSKNAGYTYINENKDAILSAMSFDERQVTMEVIRADGKSFEPSVNAMEGETVETRELYRTAKAFIGGFVYEDQQ